MRSANQRGSVILQHIFPSEFVSIQHHTKKEGSDTGKFDEVKRSSTNLSTKCGINTMVRAAMTRYTGLQLRSAMFGALSRVGEASLDGEGLVF